MSEPARDARHRLRRIPDRARYERTDLHAVLDAGFLAHVGFASAEQPFVLPMLYWRDGDDLLLHGSIASRLMGMLGTGIQACVTVTHVDGLVARLRRVYDLLRRAGAGPSGNAVQAGCEATAVTTRWTFAATKAATTAAAPARARLRWRDGVMASPSAMW